MEPFDIEAAVQAYLATVPPDARARSDAYFEGGYWLLLWSAAIGVGIYWLTLHFGIASRLARWAEQRTGNRPFAASLLFLAPYFLLVSALSLPFAIYTGFVREHQYAMSTQTFGGWLSEWGIGTVISVLLVTLAVAGILKIVRAAGNAWWAWSSIAVIVFMTFFIAIAPVTISPLFNTYEPMPEGPVKAEVLAMARANGVPADNVYVVDQSRQTKRISANVQGIGPTVRISLNDNLLERGTPAEIRAVMGHELGHYVLNHIWKMIAFYTLIILALFGLLHWLVPKMIARWGERWGVSSPADPVTVPIGGIVVTLFFLAATPLTYSLTRVQEIEADVFGLNAARAPDGFASIAMKLSEYRKLEPGRWEEIIFYTHPSGRTRAETAMRWKAEHLGEPGVE